MLKSKKNLHVAVRSSIAEFWFVKTIIFKGCLNYLTVSARHFNPSAHLEKQLSKFMNTNGVLICDKKGKSTPIETFFSKYLIKC